MEVIGLEILVKDDNYYLLIYNEENEIDYTIYDIDKHFLDGGEIEIEGMVENDIAIQKVIEAILPKYSFSSSYVLYSPEETRELAEELFEKENEENIKNELDGCL